MRSVLLKKTKRFIFGHNDILQNRLLEFKRDDPCVLAMGGLIHTMVCRCTWLDPATEQVFNVEEDE